MRTMGKFLVLAAVLGLGAASPGRAGQVRIDVGPSGSLSFSPAAASLNPGDHVVWVWKSGSHTVTQGAPCSIPASPLFNSGLSSLSNARFSWKSAGSGTIPYFCIPHCASLMRGTLALSATHVAVSDFRITEVHRSSAHEDDYVEIANLGDAAGNLGQYRVYLSSGLTQAMLTIPVTDLTVPSGGRVVVHLGQSGTNTSTNVFIATGTLQALASLSLYAPNTVDTAPNANMIIDFVQWGAADINSQGFAATANLWVAGTFASQIPDGHALEFCGTDANHGDTFWHEITVPNPGTNGNCASPVKPETWGGVKALYR